jgi:hypothetical protein
MRWLKHSKYGTKGARGVELLNHSAIIGWAALLAMAVLLGAASSGAAEIEGVEFDERVTAGERVLALQSVGLLRYRVIFKGYVAALYLEEGTSPEAVLEDVSKRLELEYFWSIAGEKFGPVAESVLERNLDARSLERLRPRVEALHEKYQDVKPGDRYAITYLPGEGTELAKNGVRLALVPGEDFASAYFGIWLGEAPLDRALRDQLLKER